MHQQAAAQLADASALDSPAPSDNESHVEPVQNSDMQLEQDQAAAVADGQQRWDSNIRLEQLQAAAETYASRYPSPATLAHVLPPAFVAACQRLSRGRDQQEVATQSHSRAAPFNPQAQLKQLLGTLSSNTLLPLPVQPLVLQPIPLQPLHHASDASAGSKGNKGGHAGVFASVSEPAQMAQDPSVVSAALGSNITAPALAHQQPAVRPVYAATAMHRAVQNAGKPAAQLGIPELFTAKRGAVPAALGATERASNGVDVRTAGQHPASSAARYGDPGAGDAVHEKSMRPALHMFTADAATGLMGSDTVHSTSGTSASATGQAAEEGVQDRKRSAEDTELGGAQPKRQKGGHSNHMLVAVNQHGVASMQVDGIVNHSMRRVVRRRPGR